MSDLSIDTRTAGAFAAATVRASRYPGAGRLDARGTPVTVLLATLEQDEQVCWLGWAVEADVAGARWVVALTGHRLVGAAPAPRAGYDRWQLPTSAWTATGSGHDVVLTLVQGAPLRLLGARVDTLQDPFGLRVPGTAARPAAPTPVFAPARPGTAAPPAATRPPARPASAHPTPVPPPSVPAAAPAADGHEGAAVGSWQEAEALAAWHLRQLGFDDAKVTNAGADGGLDVVATGAVAQVKHHAQPVGAPAVQQLRGAAHDVEWMLFYALSGYTRAAVEFADRTKIALFTYDSTAAVTPANDAAAFLLRARGMDGPVRAEHFELEQLVKQVGQQYFDLCWSEMSTTVEGILARAGGRLTPALHAARAELNRVMPMLEHVNSGPIPLDVLGYYCGQIREGTARLRALP